ncbi:gluconate 2-dehydrogenase subunit 3 family protein [Pricia sp. S334]|uniref:Gluconate 2-dehydrogenase subunit 3 family protein n=1 Tax=Pricia mediterranea TaxID=3076079 RepID=A0ABU3L6Z2_9FLAO|nr:gluconate 2-dehydrogenase subunit 3 family protein [Pricia sp. S334]MDT7829096.1 gluconate 2-dehydrogenase subunit 3 family protein [Pricia sp. S334]
MDRRKALRNMGLALGYTVTAPTLISIVQSCKNETELEWTPDFFSKDEGAALTKLVDIIIPKTDTPSASETQVHLFIDRFTDQVMEPQQQEFVKMSIGRFMEKALKDSEKEKAGDLTPEELEPVLATALKTTPEDQIKNFEAIKQYHEALTDGKEAILAEDIFRFAFANNLRGLTIMGYKTSEYVGEEILEYLPVPGEYIPCDDLQELTGGKAWSI